MVLTLNIQPAFWQSSRPAIIATMDNSEKCNLSAKTSVQEIDDEEK